FRAAAARLSFSDRVPPPAAMSFSSSASPLAAAEPPRFSYTSFAFLTRLPNRMRVPPLFVPEVSLVPRWIRVHWGVVGDRMSAPASALLFARAGLPAMGLDA